VARETLFSAFYQADQSISRRYGGTGLGLAICQRFVDLMEGTIGADSVEGQGSTFWFEVPMRAATPAESAAGVLPDHDRDAPEQKTVRPSPQSLNVLLAEDNVVNRKVATAFLERAGHRVTIARDGYEAVAQAGRGGFDVVLMDVNMPGMDGYEATSRIRALAEMRGRVPILALTASAMRGEAERCRAAGMDGYLAKPIDAEILEREIHAVVERWKVEKANGAEAGAPVGQRLAITERPLLEPAALHMLQSQLGHEYLEELLREFLVQARHYVTLSSTAADALEDPSVRRAVHDLKSTSINFGFCRLGALAESLETACRESDVSRVKDLAGSLEGCFDASVQALARKYPHMAMAAE
jgi:CheY-like chemotaxis protein/HPt (histidine-containing phosphotransfer) domain-containing protein